MKRVGFFSFLAIQFLIQCSGSERSDDPGEPLFERIDSAQTNVNFVNQLSPTEEFNMYIFRNFYNGGGVAIGDVTGNGLPDLFLTGNMTSNRLYINRGDFRFIDVTDTAGLNSEGYWSTGVSMADVNGDGLLDIYVTLSGEPDGSERHNRLYINNGDSSAEKDGSGLSFTESSKEYNLTDENLSTHGLFFDYDGDGLLDLYLIANSFHDVGGYRGVLGDQRKIPDPRGSSKLYKNEGGSFRDVTEEAGILSSIIGFGLSAAAADINRNGLPDLYVANDFFERDYLYINNGDGTFTESLPDYIRSLSFSSMGSDIADVNNDGWPDIFVTDMLPDDEERLKSKMTIETWDEYQYNVSRGFHHKFTRNTLQLNRGNDDGFSETGRLAGTYATDWSWAALIADFDNSGHSDIFVANGIFKDLLDQDYIEQIANPRAIGRMIQSGDENVIMNLLEAMSSTPVPNRIFRNENGIEFSDRTEEWGIGEPGFSTGAAWADLDGDGALDLVVNDVNGEVRIYRNRANEIHPDRTWLKVKLKGEAPNTFGIGAQLQVWAGGEYRFREHFLQRGFQSSVEPGFHVGLGEITRIDSLVVRWPDGRSSSLYNVDLPSEMTLFQSEASQRVIAGPPPAGLPGDIATGRSTYPNAYSNPPLFRRAELPGISDWKHSAFEFNEFNREPLLNYKRSTEGPAFCKGDVNGDGLDDIYMGGARGQAGRLMVQQENGRFISSQQQLFEADGISEDIDCAFFDAIGNNLDDLYVVSGGNTFPSSSTALIDRFYLNSGDGVLTKTDQILPTGRGFEPGSVVAPHDFTGDGIMDLFVGIRLKPFAVGVPVNGYLLEGDGAGNFTDVTVDAAPELIGAGMITDALWSDVTGNDEKELILAGEWMPVRVFSKQGDRFMEITASLGLENTKGWWNALAAGDLDGDGRTDLIGANHGSNSIFRAEADMPVRMWVGDLSGNGIVEQIVAKPVDGKYYPAALRPDMTEAIPAMNSRFPTYESYAGKTVDELFTSDELDRAAVMEAELLESVVIWNKPDGIKIEPLPVRAQLAPMFAIEIDGGAASGYPEILLGGNLFDVKPHIGPYDASRGVLISYSNEKLSSLKPADSGINIPGEIRKIETVDIAGETYLIFMRYGDTPYVLKRNR